MIMLTRSSERIIDSMRYTDFTVPWYLLKMNPNRIGWFSIFYGSKITVSLNPSDNLHWSIILNFIAQIVQHQWLPVALNSVIIKLYFDHKNPISVVLWSIFLNNSNHNLVNQPTQFPTMIHWINQYMKQYRRHITDVRVNPLMPVGNYRY